MSDLNFLNIADEKGLEWLERLSLPWVNTYSWAGAKDKKGWPYFTLGWNRRPDSDWGKYEPRAILRAKTDELLAQAEVIIRRKLGYDPQDGFMSEYLSASLKAAKGGA